jgi:hypothetical protein
VKHKVAELEGARLDRAVALAAGVAVGMWGERPYLEGGHHGQTGSNVTTWSPSTDWAQGGPLIESERITIVASTGIDEPLFWSAAVGAFSHYIDEAIYSDKPCPGGSFNAVGPTPLIAAMRAFVASKFGDEVELP